MFTIQLRLVFKHIIFKYFILYSQLKQYFYFIIITVFFSFQSIIYFSFLCKSVLQSHSPHVPIESSERENNRTLSYN